MFALVRMHWRKRSSRISKSRTATTLTSHVEAEVHDIAFVDDVLLALEPQLAGFLRALLALVRDIVVVGDDLGADEPFLEVGMDHAGRLRRSGADLHRP